jgi:hypothetical protein
MRQSLDWYVERFRKNPFDHLVGIEVTNCPGRTEPYSEGLWDQLLARFMPQRPIWGIGCDDMHKLEGAKQTFSVFLLSTHTEANVRKAMETGQFYFCKSTKNMDYTAEPSQLSPFPEIASIDHSQKTGTITVSATGYDTIQWISSPPSLVPTEDYRTSDSPWPLGQVVHTGSTLNYRTTPNIKHYVRAELLKKDGEHIHRTFTNPFGICV